VKPRPSRMGCWWRFVLFLVAVVIWQNGTLVYGSPAYARADPWASSTRRTPVKSGIHPAYVPTEVVCTCGSTFVTRSTVTDGTIRADVCSACHPFYTGKQKILDTGGRVARFEARYGKKAAK